MEGFPIAQSADAFRGWKTHVEAFIISHSFGIRVRAVTVSFGIANYRTSGVPWV